MTTPGALQHRLAISFPRGPPVVEPVDRRLNGLDDRDDVSRGEEGVGEGDDVGDPACLSVSPGPATASNASVRAVFGRHARAQVGSDRLGEAARRCHQLQAGDPLVVAVE